jgi:hypothetical protein
LLLCPLLSLPAGLLCSPSHCLLQIQLLQEKKRSSHTEGAVWRPATTEFFEKRWDARRTCRGYYCCCCNPWVLLLCSWRDALDPSSPERAGVWVGMGIKQSIFLRGGENPNNTWESVSKLLKQTQTQKKTHTSTNTSAMEITHAKSKTFQLPKYMIA